VGLALVRSFGTASATPLCLRRWIVPLLLDHTNIAYCTTKAHRAVMFTIAQLSCIYHTYIYQIPWQCIPSTEDAKPSLHAQKPSLQNDFVTAQSSSTLQALPTPEKPVETNNCVVWVGYKVATKMHLKFSKGTAT